MTRSPYFCLLLALLFITGCLAEQQSADDSHQGSEKPTAVVSVAGQLRYQDRPYNRSGFINSAENFQAIGLVPVELYDLDNQLVASTLADVNGTFVLPDIGIGDYSLRVLAQVDHASGTRIQIQSMTGQLYAIEQAISLSAQNTDVQFTATVQDRVAGIFNLLDVMQLGLDYATQLNLDLPPVNDLNVYWQWGQLNNTYTCRGHSDACPLGAGIYVLSDPLRSRDTDEFDDDVLWHELAHHLEVSWGMLDSPGGAHSLLSRTLDLRLAWSEGMASAFAVAVKRWLRSSAPERLSAQSSVGSDSTYFYIDTQGSSAQISVDLLSASSAHYRYVTNEVAVASGILRLQAQTGVAAWQTLWQALHTNLTADTMDAYWDALLARLEPSAADLSRWQATVATKQIHYQLDQAENNDSAFSAEPLRVNEPQTHTLYRSHSAIDEDWFALTLQAGERYRIRTFDLTNGADTDLHLYGPELTLLASNDDAEDCGTCQPLHDGVHFSSQLEYTATATATHYVRIRTADAVYQDPAAYGYVGRYGGYSIGFSPL